MTVLLHDIRTPLGVASGYLRLLQEGRFPDDASRTRAIEKAQQALARVAQTCEEAGSLSGSADLPPPSLIAARALVDGVTAAAEAAGHGTLVAPGRVDGQVGISVSVDLVAHAVAQVLHSACGAEPPATRGVDRQGTRLRFWARRATVAGVPEDEWVPYDPWHRGGLTLPLACQRIALGRGEVWITPGRDAVAVTFPVETNS